MCLLVGITVNAQTPEDALRTAWYSYNGTGRFMATGGVMGSLGGDITANHTNPAGLGLYKTREVVLTPGFALNNNKFNYRGADTSNSKNSFNYGTTGVVLGSIGSGRSTWTSSAFAVSVNQVASYNNHIHYSGNNNQSSFTEQYLEELTRDRADSNAALGNYIFGSSLAFRTFLIDTTAGPGGAVTGYQSLVPISTGVNQLYDADTRGGYHEIALGLAGNVQDRLYLGGSLTIPIIYYQRNLTYSETDATASTTNQFNSFQYKETFTSSGIGIGAKLGLIFKPTDFMRLGFAVHTPQLISYKDHISSSITANTESYAGIKTAASNDLNGGKPGESEYNLITPWRAIASVSYVFGGNSDTRQQHGFFSADLEYVNYRGARYSGASTADQPLVDYYKLINSVIKDTYKGNVNMRIGGELKFNTFMLRLGGAYYGSPYADDNLKASKILASGGIGYRDHGMFVDLSYVHAFNKDAQFPYRLNDKPNTFAQQSGSRGTVVLSVGFKF